MKRCALLCAMFLTLVSTRPAEAAYGHAVLLFNLQDAEIDESSGVVAGSQDGVLFTHNDSEDAPPWRFFAVGANGQTLATYTAIGSLNTDWEDMSRGPGSDGKPALFFGDIGDNFLIRPFLVIYEVAEPAVDVASEGAQVQVPVVSIKRFVYPDGRHDSETLLVHPVTGEIAVVTKDATGESGVYVEGEEILPGLATLTRVATISFTKIARPYQPTDFDQTSRLLATGGDISPDGRRLVVRTYVEAFEWDISKGLATGLNGAPLRIELPFTKQGEAICYARDGRAVLTTSEQLPAPVHRIGSAA
jgi:hypothetical protein